MFNKENIRKCCCFPVLFEEKATKTEVKCAVERINQLEKRISTVVNKCDNRQESARTEGDGYKQTKRRKKRILSVSKSKSKINVKIWPDGKNGTENIELSCGCILKKTFDSGSARVSSIASSSSDKSTSFVKLHPSSPEEPGFRVKNVKFTSDASHPFISQESELKLILKNDPVEISKEHVFQQPNIIKSLSTCGCGFEKCKTEWDFSRSDRNNTQTSDAKKQLIDCGINTLDQVLPKDTVEHKTKKKVAVCEDVGSMTCEDVGSSASPFTRQMYTSTQTCDNSSCPEDSFALAVGSKGYEDQPELHCLPSPMAASGKYRQQKRSGACNPLRYKVSRSNLNRMSKTNLDEYPSRVSVLRPKKNRFKCFNKNKKTKFYIDETEELVCPPKDRPFIKYLLPKTKTGRRKNSTKDMKIGPSEIIKITPSLPSCSTNCSEISDNRSYIYELPEVRKKNTYKIVKVVKNPSPQHIVKLSQEQLQPTYLLMEPSKKSRQGREEYVVQSSFQNLDQEDSDSRASGLREKM